MSQAIHISDELYHKLAEQARHHGQPIESFVEEQLAAIVEEPPGAPKSPLFEIMGMFSEPIEGIELGWKERHDEIIAEEAIDPHADAEK